MSIVARFGARRLAAVGAAVALGSGAASVGLLSAAPPALATVTPTCSQSGTSTVTVTCTPGTGTWTPPAGVTSAQVVDQGAGGGTGGNGGATGGKGGSSSTTLTVSSANTYSVTVSARGANAAADSFLGGSGGGSSEIDLGTSCASNTCRLVVAGGGGGGGAGLGTQGGGGGGGGGTSGTVGQGGVTTAVCVPAGGGGQPGTATGPGQGGGAGGACPGGQGGGPGGTPTGSTGGAGGRPGQNSFGGGGSGGGGFFGGGGGGGGGDFSTGGGGGGGSGHLDSTTTTGGSTGAGTNTGDGSVTITYINPTMPPHITKAFGTSSIPFGGSTSLSFTINNPNASAQLTGVGFTDTLPSGLVVATPSNGLTGSCGGGTITANPDGSSVKLTGATLAGGSSCTFAVNVTGISPGLAFKNITSAVTSTEGGAGNMAVDGIEVLGCPASQPFPHLLTAHTNAGTILGGFCVNSFGTGTYTQGSVSGTGIVHQITGGTQIQAFGNNLILGGQRFGTTNQFSETRPVSAFGTYSLS